MHGLPIQPKFNTLTFSNEVSSRDGYLAIIVVFTVHGYHRNIAYIMLCFIARHSI